MKTTHRAAIALMGTILAALVPTIAGAQEAAPDDFSPGTYVEGGVPFSVDPLPPTPPPSSSTDRQASAAAPFANDQTFLLHSRPGSQRVIYLDFNGQNVSGTFWNNEYGGPLLIHATPYDTDNVPGTFDQNEINVIQSIWQRAAEDYAPFNVDVTTQDPGTGALNRTDSNDPTFGTRVVITNLLGVKGDCGCGGTAAIGTFDLSNSGYYQPAWVFAGAPSQAGAKILGEAVSHEVGHNFGLVHDTVASDPSGYYSPTGVWAPIMGAAYYSPVSQFSSGEYPDAFNRNTANPPVQIPLQDDLAIIAAHGAPVVPDEPGNDAATAQVLPGQTGPWTAAGIIATRTDQDWFKIMTPAGHLDVNASNAGTSPNLDLRLDLRDASGAILNTANPTTTVASRDVADGMDASLGVDLAAGTYLLSLDGVGEGTPLTGGYSDYDSLGSYSFTATFTPVPSYVPSSPARLMDSRPGWATVDGQFAGIGTRMAGSVTELQVGGRAGVPTNAAAVVLNVTATEPTSPGHVTVFPCGEAVPNASNLNYAQGQTIANTVIAKVGAGGKVCLATASDTQLIVDINGHYPAGSSYAASSPARLMDSRPGWATVDGQFAGIGTRMAGSVTELQVGGRAGVPTNAAAVVLNVTATEPTSPGHVTVFPCGEAVPNASNLNYAQGQTIANTVIAKVGAGGKVCLATASDTQLIVDINGHYPAGSSYAASSPARLMDSRPGWATVDGQFAGIGTRMAGSVTELQVGGRAGVPTNAAAVVLNVTATEPTSPGHVTVFPCGEAVPNASNLNYAQGQTIANTVIAKVGAGGKVCLATASDTQLIVDINGHYPA